MTVAESMFSTKIYRIQLDRHQASMKDDQLAILCCNLVAVGHGDTYLLEWQMNRPLCFCNLSQSSLMDNSSSRILSCPFAG